MKDKPENIDLILPFGERLRGFMEQSFITKGDLNRLLRNRGVFTCRSEKQDTIPILTTFLLSPNEFDFLRECQTTKEDNPKIATQVIGWSSSQNYLIESIPDSINLNNLIPGDFKNYTVLGSPNFFMVDENPDNIRIEFEIERKDLTRNWATEKSRFKGSLNIIKSEKKDKIRMTMTNTANETRQINQKLIQSLIHHFKINDFVPEKAEVEKILFRCFSNTERIDFFLALTQTMHSEYLEFKDIVDIEFCPENTPGLPERIEWMEQRINNLKLNGKSLHETFFVQEKEYHQHISMYSIDAKFEFDFQEAEGNCVINFSFPNFSKEKDKTIELEINVSSLKLGEESRHRNTIQIKELLLKEIDNVKIDVFEKHKQRA